MKHVNYVVFWVLAMLPFLGLGVGVWLQLARIARALEVYSRK